MIIHEKKRRTNESGQVVAEFGIALFFVFVPLVAGSALWAHLEWNRFRCAFNGFFNARQQLIVTNQTVHYTIQYGKLTEQINLVPLEQLDTNRGALGLGEATNEVLELSKQASSFLSSLRDMASSKSSLTRKK